MELNKIKCPSGFLEHSYNGFEGERSEERKEFEADRKKDKVDGVIVGSKEAWSYFSTLKGANFMTPEIINYFQNGKYSIELSSGQGFSGSIDLFGVTVMVGTVKKDNLSRVFENLDDAWDYIKSLV